MSLLQKGLPVSSYLFRVCKSGQGPLKSVCDVALCRGYATATKKPGKGLFKLGLVGITVGALIGTGYSVKQLNKTHTHIANEQTVIPFIKKEEVPQIKPSRKVI